MKTRKIFTDALYYVVIDDKMPERLDRDYSFKCQHHINAQGQNEVGYYLEKLSKILGALPPRQTHVAMALRDDRSGSSGPQ